FELSQPQDLVTVEAGQTLTLTCTVFGDGPIGPVKWLKGQSGVVIYDQTNPFPRVTRAVNESNTDFTIHIRDVVPEDAGTYYCVKFRKTLQGDMEFRRGKGTEVSVRAKPTRPLVSGPGRRAGPGESVPFTCVAGGFFPEDISVKWFKDEAPVSAQPPHVTAADTGSSFRMASAVTVTLQQDDVRSQLTCQVQHPTLPTPLRGTFQLREALRVSPGVRVAADPQGPVELNKTASFVCDVAGFYPADVDVTWLEDGVEVKVENGSRASETSRGLFQLRSLLEVPATEEKNGSVFSCRVVHDAQAPVTEKVVLWVTSPAKG
ncbi:SHPS1 phosphatase, partial [Centropus unirufus]|nr:SHPS1 phosphatase [Centropus unirufus]